MQDHEEVHSSRVHYMHVHEIIVLKYVVFV